MSKELFQEIREEAIGYPENDRIFTFEDLERQQRRESFNSQSNLTKEESDSQEMPYDFWNHGFNGHSGFKNERWETESVNLDYY